MIRERVNNSEIQNCSHKMIFDIDNIWYFGIWLCIILSNYLINICYIGHINCLKTSNDKKLLLFNIKSHLGHKSIAEVSICVQV